MQSNLALELFEPALALLQGARHHLIIGCSDCSPEQLELLNNERISNAAMDLAATVAEELEQFGIGSLAEVLQMQSQRLVRFSVLATLVLGNASVTRSIIISRQAR